MLSQFTYGQTFCAVEHVIHNAKEQINGLVLSQKNKELTLDSDFSTGAVKSVKNHIASKQHLFLIMNTDKVLFKSLNSVLEPIQAVQQAFPNIKLDDFYYETCIGSSTTFVAICRKSDVNSILASYDDEGYAVIGFSLGNLVIASLAAFINQQGIHTSNATVQFEDQNLLNISLNGAEASSYNINGLAIKNSNVLALAGILKYYTGASNTTSNFEQLNNDLEEKFKQQHVFNLGLKISLATIFVLLLFSFLLFTNYTTKIEALNTTLALNKTQKTSLLKLSDEVQKKEKLIKDFSLAASKSSWYIDQIAVGVPKAISLSEVQWQPLTSAIKEDKAIQMSQQVILIKGTSTNGEAFSNWHSKLEQLDWIEKVTINDYGVGRKVSTSFELEISFTP